MKINWKNLRGTDLRTMWEAIPLHPDWSDPTHAPIMVSEVMADLGNCCAECLSDEEQSALCGAAIDAMPGGESAVRADLEDRIRDLAAVRGWGEWLYEPGTRQYPWEDAE